MCVVGCECVIESMPSVLLHVVCVCVCMAVCECVVSVYGCVNGKYVLLCERVWLCVSSKCVWLYVCVVCVCGCI